jgi:uncharacterized protein (UPF0210 family)
MRLRRRLCAFFVVALAVIVAGGAHAAALPKVRAVTAFVRLDSAEPTRSIDEAMKVLGDARKAFAERGYEVQTVRIVTQPFGELIAGLSDEKALDLLQRLDALAGKQDFALNIGPAMLRDGDDLRAMHLLARFLATGAHTNASAIVAADDGIHWKVVRASAELIHDVAEHSPHGQGNFNFGATALQQPYGPFFPGAWHAGAGRNLSIGLESANLVQDVFARTRGDFDASVRELGAALATHARVAEEVGMRVARQHGWTYMGVDPTPAPLGDTSIGAAMESWSGGRFGSSGTMTAAFAITSAVKSVPVKRVGYSGLMVPVLEDKRLAERWAEGSYGIDSLLAYSSVCATGLDTVPLPGDIGVNQLERIIGDVAALAWKWKKPLTARLLPLPGKGAGDRTEFDSPYLFNTTLQVLPH